MTYVFILAMPIWCQKVSLFPYPPKFSSDSPAYHAMVKRTVPTPGTQNSKEPRPGFKSNSVTLGKFPNLSYLTFFNWKSKIMVVRSLQSCGGDYMSENTKGTIIE